MATSAGTRQSLPTFIPNEIEHRKQISAWMREVHQGKLANTGSVTLTTSAASTVVLDSRVGNFSYIGLMPTTASAASAVADGSVYVSSQSKQAFTITHTNNAVADRTFRYAILG